MTEPDTPTPLRPRGLLSAAERLLHLPEDQDRPLPEWIRRSVSTAYYAVFTALCEAVASRYEGIGARTLAMRAVSHNTAKTVCVELSRRGVVSWMPGSPPCPPDIAGFVADFVILQRARVDADYNPIYKLSEEDAREVLERAVRAVEALESAQTACPDQYEAVCLAMIAPGSARERTARAF